MEDKNISYAVIIPALNPRPDLVDFVQKLLMRGIPRVIIVNDGSDCSFNDIFHAAGELEHCTVLTHNVNRGKGRALKTAFSFFLKNYPDLSGVVTADADGQHAVDDICRVGGMLSIKQDSLILGVRNFKDKSVPRRSYIGNQTTSRIFKLLYGYYLNDTQTGLRGIPSSQLKWMVDMNGERYDFEINMLIYARIRKLDFYTLPIKTLYYDNNSGSHYSTIKDSARIFVCLVKGLFHHSKYKAQTESEHTNTFVSMKNIKQSVTFKFARFLFRCFTPHYNVYRTHKVPDPAVYIVHHQNMHGPVTSMAWFDKHVRLWVLNAFCSIRSCFHQYYHYTFTKRYGMPKFVAAIAALIPSLLVPKLMHAMKAIPVFRESRDIVKTFKQSISALIDGQNILLCPDIDYTDTSYNIGEMYTGFLDLEKYFLKQTGKHLAFVPLHICDADHGIYVGQAVYFSGEDTFRQEKERVYNLLKQEFSHLETCSERRDVTNATNENYQDRSFH